MIMGHFLVNGFAGAFAPAPLGRPQCASELAHWQDLGEQAKVFFVWLFGAPLSCIRALRDGAFKSAFLWACRILYTITLRRRKAFPL
jgi:hypothetical protein